MSIIQNTLRTLTTQQQDKQLKQKMGKGLEEIFLQTETQIVKKHMKIFNIISH